METKPRVLLIDDSEVVVSAVSLALAQQGFEVRAARSIGELHALLEAWSPTIVLTDVNMPGFTGPELCKWIKGRIDTSSVPVVLFSELPERELEAVAHASGADGFISKMDGVEALGRTLSSISEAILW